MGRFADVKMKDFRNRDHQRSEETRRQYLQRHSRARRLVSGRWELVGTETRKGRVPVQGSVKHGRAQPREGATGQGGRGQSVHGRGHRRGAGLWLTEAKPLPRDASGMRGARPTEAHSRGEEPCGVQSPERGRLRPGEEPPSARQEGRPCVGEDWLRAQR